MVDQDTPGQMAEMIPFESVRPAPGDRHPGFVEEPGRCWALVYSVQPQATYSRDAPIYHTVLR
jgi:hypothetical protein